MSDDIKMQMRAQIGAVTARDAMAKLDSDVDALTAAAAKDPKSNYTADTKTKAEYMRGWGEALARKWGRFIRAN
jgi:hypothetical protein